MADSLGGADGDLGAATTYDEDVNGGPPYQALVEIWECSPRTESGYDLVQGQVPFGPPVLSSQR
jgi:hypothetical protein